MTEREVTFLLKRRGITPPGDAEQARSMAQEQRNQDMEKARSLSVRELKEALQSSGSDISTVIEADELRRLFCKKLERDLFNRTRPSRPSQPPRQSSTGTSFKML